MIMNIKIMVMTALTLSSKPEMPIPEAAAVPAKPMKWPDLVVMMMMMITSMIMMMRLAPTRVQCIVDDDMDDDMDDDDDDSKHDSEDGHPIFDAKRLAPTRVQCMEREARK